MTEKEVDQMIADAQGVECDPVLERQYLESQIPELKKQIARFHVLFRIHRLMREDEKMKQAHKDLMGLKTALEWMDNRLIELSR